MMRTVLHFESRDLKGAPRARTQTSPSDRVPCRYHRGAGYACLPVLGAVYVSLYVADAVSFFRLMFARREPSCVHPAGERNIEVTLAALSSCARAAAERDDRVMVERVEARVQGSDESRVCFKVDAIALDDRDVASLATAMQQRIEEACDTMLGTPGTTARVRFLPSKTTVQTVEVSGE